MTDKFWKCTIEALSKAEGLETEEVELDFADYDSLADASFVLKSNYLEEFIEKIKTNEKYSLSGGITQLIAPDGTDYSKHSFFAILGVDNSGLLLGILLGELKDSTFKVVGFFPGELSTQLEQNPNVIKNLAVLLLVQDEMWQLVNIVVPNQEPETKTEVKTKAEE